MQFVPNGPDVPDRLLQAHEEGRVVFFCGAGISVPAGLPQFGKLVDDLFEQLMPRRSSIQAAAVKAQKYDLAISLLEREVTREVVRRKVFDILQPDLTRKDALATHAALLDLSLAEKGRHRLITTNFDRLFHLACQQRGIRVPFYTAPCLPIPKNHKWDGLVNLHGLLPESAYGAEVELQKLVLSSGDFGLAYLTERWASRFTSELFRGYTVCFVGYSLSDPVLRYMMDALAADAQQVGAEGTEMYAFGSYRRGKQPREFMEWESKHVTPILYKEDSTHSLFHRTLRIWADDFRSGARGKERIVARHAVSVPGGSTPTDDYVGRVLWALSDPEGLPSRVFAELDPPPPLEWLQIFTEKRFGPKDFGRFGITGEFPNPGKVAFSLLERPTPSPLAPRMSMFVSRFQQGQWDRVMFHLAKWLARHLDQPRLALWVAGESDLHPAFLRILNETFQQGGLSEPMRRIWGVILHGQLRVERDRDWYAWSNDFKLQGFTFSLRRELLNLIQPCVHFSPPIQWPWRGDRSPDAPRVKELVDWEVVLQAEGVHDVLQSLANLPAWRSGLPALMDGSVQALADALELMEDLGGASDRSDRSYLDQPSISKHAQNHHHHEWTALIEMVRDAWEETRIVEPEKAHFDARRWVTHQRFPLFKRLAFYAAAQMESIDAAEAVDWLLVDGGWWLWAMETRRECVRLIVSLASRVQNRRALVDRLAEAMLEGPPRSLYRPDLDEKTWHEIQDRSTWLLLAKAAQTGLQLGPKARKRLEALSAQNPDWMLAEDQSDEFPIWSGGGPSWVGSREPALPQGREAMLNWLRDHSQERYVGRGWSERCKESFEDCSWAILALTIEGLWPSQFWIDALQCWSSKEFILPSWETLAPALLEAPGEALRGIAPASAWWFDAAAQDVALEDPRFLQLAEKFLDHSDIERSGGATRVDEQVLAHPAGLVTHGILAWWFRSAPQDALGLELPLADLLRRICNPKLTLLRPGRFILAANAVSLIRVDERWTLEHLIPLFTWKTSTLEARNAWDGYLSSTQISYALLQILKPELLKCPERYARAPEASMRRLAGFLVFLALDKGGLLTEKQLAIALSSLTPKGIEQAAWWLVQMVEENSEKRQEYVQDRILPFLERIWPRTSAKGSPGTSNHLVRLLVLVGEGMPEAWRILRPWILPLRHPEWLTQKLAQSDLPRQFPRACLELLDQSIRGSDIIGTMHPLQICLTAVGDVDPSLKEADAFRRLEDLTRLHPI